MMTYKTLVLNTIPEGFIKKLLEAMLIKFQFCRSQCFFNLWVSDLCAPIIYGPFYSFLLGNLAFEWLWGYNVCLISIGISVSDWATNKLVLNWKFTVWLTLPMNMSHVYRIHFAQHGLKNSKFYKECLTSLALFATQRFCSFWKTISPWILCTQLNISPCIKFP